jgi:hypothetical protein
MPKIRSVTPLTDCRIRISWENSLRPHATEDVDLGPLIETLKFYRPLRNNKSLLATVHVIANGNAIAWGDGNVDMAATSIERLAEEAMTADDFRVFLHDNGLTREKAAIVLDRSKRQIAYYLSGKQPIPRIVVLACYGYLARRQIVAGGIRAGSIVTTGDHQYIVASREIRTGRATVAA